MKQIPNKLLIAIFAIMIFVGCSSTKNFKPLEASDVAVMVKNHEFHFVAEKMNPLRGPQRNLNSYYDLLIKRDTLKSFLPYYGRAFVAPVDPTQGGLRFNSYDFAYEYAMDNKRWTVTVTPKDVTQITRMTFTIFDNGNTTLHVNSVNLDPISFTGHLEKVE